MGQTPDGVVRTAACEHNMLFNKSRAEAPGFFWCLFLECLWYTRVSTFASEGNFRPWRQIGFMHELPCSLTCLFIFYFHILNSWTSWMKDCGEKKQSRVLQMSEYYKYDNAMHQTNVCVYAGLHITLCYSGTSRLCLVRTPHVTPDLMKPTVSQRTFHFQYTAAPPFYLFIYFLNQTTAAWVFEYLTKGTLPSADSAQFSSVCRGA